MKTKKIKKISKCIDVDAQKYENYPTANYTGFNGYHTLPSNFTRSVNELGGCCGVEIEMSFDKNEWGRKIFTDSLSSNLIWASSDGSLSGVQPLEICTVPLMRYDATSPAFWKPLCKRLVQLGARSRKNATTGLHVHVDRRNFYSKTDRAGSDEYEIMCARTIYGLYVQDAPWKKTLFQRSNNNYAVKNIQGEIMKVVQTILPEAIRSKECVEKIINEARGGAIERYSEFNCTNAKTIEFRCGKGTLNPERIAATAEFALIFADYCRAYGKRIPMTSQKHFEAFVARHARKNSMLRTIFKPSEEE